jgi:hypothetical protein
VRSTRSIDASKALISKSGKADSTKTFADDPRTAEELPSTSHQQSCPCFRSDQQKLHSHLFSFSSFEFTLFASRACRLAPRVLLGEKEASERNVPDGYRCQCQHLGLGSFRGRDPCRYPYNHSKPTPASAMETDMDMDFRRRIEVWIMASMRKLKRMTTWKVGSPSLLPSFLASFPPSSLPTFLLSFRHALPCTSPLLTVVSHVSKPEPPTARGNRRLRSHANTTGGLSGSEAG